MPCCGHQNEVGCIQTCALHNQCTSCRCTMHKVRLHNAHRQLHNAHSIMQLYNEHLQLHNAHAISQLHNAHRAIAKCTECNCTMHMYVHVCTCTAIANHRPSLALGGRLLLQSIVKRSCIIGRCLRCPQSQR